MIKKLILSVILLLMATTVFASQHEIASNVIKVKIPVVDNQVTRNDATEVFMELINKGSQTHILVAANSPAAKQVQLHNTIVEHGRSVMRQVPRIVVRSHHDKDLQLGGLHVMLIGLKRHLIKNQRVPITLIFRDGSWIVVNAKVS